jgi:hypothetical protein
MDPPLSWIRYYQYHCHCHCSLRLCDHATHVPALLLAPLFCYQHAALQAGLYARSAGEILSSHRAEL